MSAPSAYFEFAPADRALAVLASGSPYLPQLELEFDGQLDAARLARAVELVGHRHPILHATVDPDAWRGEWSAGTTAPEFVAMVDDGVAGRTSARARIASMTLDPSAGPTCRAVLVDAGDRSRLVLGLHHAVGDGRALVCLLDDVRRLYVALRTDDRPVVDVDWSPRTARALLDANGVDRIGRARMARDVIDRWASLEPSTHDDPPATEVGDDLGFVDCALVLD